jgi:hypothetical protein
MPSEGAPATRRACPVCLRRAPLKPAAVSMRRISPGPLRSNQGSLSEWLTPSTTPASCQNRSVMEVLVVIRVAVSIPVNDADTFLFASYAVSVKFPE